MAFDLTKPFTRVDEILTNLIVKFRVNEFKGMQLFPDFNVRKESNKFRVFLPKGFFKGAPIKADGAKTAEATLSYSEDTYTTFERAIKDLVTDRAQQNADLPVRPMIDSTNFLMEKIALSEEIDKFDLAITTLKAGGATATKTLTDGGAGTNWRGSGADPLLDFSDARRRIVKNVGKKPNWCFKNTDAHEAFLNVADIKEQIKHTSDRLVTADQPVPSVRGIPLVITDALVNIAAEDLTADFKSVMVDPSSSGNDHMTVIFAFVKLGDVVNFGVNFVSRSQRVQRWRGSEGEDREGDFIKVSKIYTPKITSVGAGFVITHILGSADE